MSEQSPFRTPPEELASLTKELGEIRAVLRELTGRLVQIERHVKRAFGVPVERETPRQKSPQRAGAARPTMSPKEALAFFDVLVALSRERDRGAAEERLSTLEIGDLRLLAEELGLPGGTKPSRRGMVASILGRVKESLMLSRNINVTEPRSAAEPSPDTPKRGGME